MKTDISPGHWPATPCPLEIQYFCHILNWKLKKNESMKAFWAFEPANSILCQLLHLKQNTNSQLLSSKLALWPLTACVSLGHIFPQNRNTVWFYSNTTYFSVAKTFSHLEEIYSKLSKQVKCKSNSHAPPNFNQLRPFTDSPFNCFLGITCNSIDGRDFLPSQIFWTRRLQRHWEKLFSPQRKNSADVEREKQIWGRGRQDAGSAEAILQQKEPEGKAKMEI